jgi:toxin FitB
MMRSDPGYLIDANVVSELYKARPDERVKSFMDSGRGPVFWISIFTIAELRKGAANPRISSARREGLTLWIDGIEARDFSNHIVGLNLNIAKIWGSLSAGPTRPPIDMFLAATAMEHDLTLVTRNVAHFRDVPVKVLNPWSDG